MSNDMNRGMGLRQALEQDHLLADCQFICLFISVKWQWQSRYVPVPSITSVKLISGLNN